MAGIVAAPTLSRDLLYNVGHVRLQRGTSRQPTRGREARAAVRVALTAGTRLGSYEIINPIGAGGMGEVYRARDTKLDRDVAIKVLPASLGDDPQALARFEREAKSVATLSHPNILGIFDFGRTEPAGGGRPAVTYAVMELLAGETLRDRLAAAPLPPRKAVDYAVQIARGLAAAHDRGFVHRDLKPENLFVTVDDRLKILDFGLAKPLDLGTSAATMASSVPTAVGTVMGTVGYMAPEQLRGHGVDHRSDIFAFGAVLHEMLTGRRAFHGESAADTISAILNREPAELDAVSASVPPALERIVRRCLEKKPELRFQSAHDLAFALETLSASRSGAAAVAPPERPTSRSRPRLPWAIAAGAVIVAAAAIALALRVPTREPPWQRFTAITDAAGIETAPSLSPDGTTVAYATRAQGTWDIYVQRVGGRRALPVAADAERDEQAPAFSPDGSFVAYHDRGTSGGIFVAGATGESSRRVTDFGFHPAWSPDGRRIAFTTEEISNPYSRLGASSLWIVEVAGGLPQEVKGTGDAAQPSWSPSGDRIVYWSNSAGQRDIYTVPAGGGTRVAVTNDAALDWDPVWSPDGRYVYFASDRGGSMNLWRVPIDERSGRPAGSAEPVTIGVQASAEMASLSGNGARLAFRSTVLAINPVAIHLDPVTLRVAGSRVLSNSNGVRFPSDVSPDGRSLALANLGEPQEDLFIGAIDGTAVRRLTDDTARDRVPVFAPDGKSIFFYSNRDGDYQVWSVGVDGGGLRKVAQGPDVGLLYPVVSPAGDRLVASSGDTGEGVFLVHLSPRTEIERRPRNLPGTRANGETFTATDWSPDGTKLAGYFQGAAGLPVAVAIYDLAGGKVASRFPHPTGYVKWMRDNRRVGFFAAGGARFMMLDTTTGQAQPLPVDLPLRDAGESFALAPDGRTIYYGGRREEADIWIVERK